MPTLQPAQLESFAAQLLAAGGASAEEAKTVAASLVADLSSHLIAITTGFTGTEVLLFGAKEGPGQVVMIVRGPTRSER